MKKLFVLLVLVAAMVAAPVFAEIGEQTWEGDFTFKFGGDFSSMQDATENDMDISLSASVGEFTTFDVSIEAEPFRTIGDDDATTKTFVVNDNGTPNDESDDFNEPAYVKTVDTQTSADGVLELDYIEMTQDFGGMFGLGFDLKMTVGNFDFGPTEYEDMEDFEFAGSNKQNAFQFEAGANGLTVTLWFPVVEMANEADEFAAKAVYESDMFNVAVNYVRFGEAAEWTWDPDGDGPFKKYTIAKDDNQGTISASAKVMPTEEATLYASVESILDVSRTEFGFGAAYTMSPLTVEACFEAWTMAEDKDVNLAEIAIDDTGFVGVGVAYDVNETVTAKAGFYYPLNSDLSMALDAGVCLDVDTVEYTLGVSYADSDDGLDAAYVAPYSAAKFGEDVAVSFKMDVDF